MTIIVICLIFGAITAAIAQTYFNPSIAHQRFAGKPPYVDKLASGHAINMQ
jgi:hypothetical protein